MCDDSKIRRSVYLGDVQAGSFRIGWQPLVAATVTTPGSANWPLAAGDVARALSAGREVWVVGFQTEECATVVLSMAENSGDTLDKTLVVGGEICPVRVRLLTLTGPMLTIVSADDGDGGTTAALAMFIETDGGC